MNSYHLFIYGAFILNIFLSYPFWPSGFSFCKFACGSMFRCFNHHSGLKTMLLFSLLVSLCPVLLKFPLGPSTLDLSVTLVLSSLLPTFSHLKIFQLYRLLKIFFDFWTSHWILKKLLWVSRFEIGGWDLCEKKKLMSWICFLHPILPGCSLCNALFFNILLGKNITIYLRKKSNYQGNEKAVNYL